MVGFEKALRAVKVIKDQIQYRSQSLLNLARGYFSLLFNKVSVAPQFNEKKWQDSHLIWLTLEFSLSAIARADHAMTKSLSF